MLAGVEIGGVEDIVLNPKDRGVLMKLRLREFVPNDSQLSIAEKGMLGEMFLLFNYGTSEENYKENEMIKGKRPVSLTEMIGTTSDMVKTVGSDAGSLITSLNKLLGDEQLGQNVKDLMEQLPKTVNSIDALVKSNQESMKSGIDGLSNSALEFENAIKKVNGLLGEIKGKKISSIVDNSDTAVKNLNANLDELQSVIQNINKTVENVNKTVVKVNSKEGSVGKLINDTQLHDNINELIIKSTALISMLEENPSSIIWGKKKKKQDNVKYERRRRRERPSDNQNSKNHKVLNPLILHD